MWNKFYSHFLDEAVGAVLLHKFLRYRNHPPLKGETSNYFPDIFSGDLHRFIHPGPALIENWEYSHTVSDRDDYLIQNFHFPSQITTAHPENNFVRGRHWQAKENRQDLTVIGIDGLVQLNCGWFRALSEGLSNHGIDIAMIDAPYNHWRTPKGYRSGQLILGGDMDHLFSVCRQAVLDLRTTIRTLKNKGQRVGLVGISYGGWMSLMASLFEPELEFVITLAPPVDIGKIIQEGGTLVRAIRKNIGYIEIDEEEIARVSKPVAPIEWMPELCSSRIFLHAARHDRFVPTHRIAELASKWNCSLRLHDCGHCEISARRRIARLIAKDITHLSKRSQICSNKTNSDSIQLNSETVTPQI